MLRVRCCAGQSSFSLLRELRSGSLTTMVCLLGCDELRHSAGANGKRSLAASVFRRLKAKQATCTMGAFILVSIPCVIIVINWAFTLGQKKNFHQLSKVTPRTRAIDVEVSEYEFRPSALQQYQKPPKCYMTFRSRGSFSTQMDTIRRLLVSCLICYAFFIGELFVMVYQLNDSHHMCSLRSVFVCFFLAPHLRERDDRDSTIVENPLISSSLEHLSLCWTIVHCDEYSLLSRRQTEKTSKEKGGERGGCNPTHLNVSHHTSLNHICTVRSFVI